MEGSPADASGFEFGTHVVSWLYRYTDECPLLAGVGTPMGQSEPPTLGAERLAHHRH